MLLRASWQDSCHHRYGQLVVIAAVNIQKECSQQWMLGTGSIAQNGRSSCLMLRRRFLGSHIPVLKGVMTTSGLPPDGHWQVLRVPPQRSHPAPAQSR